MTNVSKDTDLFVNSSNELNVSIKGYCDFDLWPDDLKIIWGHAQPPWQVQGVDKL